MYDHDIFDRVITELDCITLHCLTPYTTFIKINKRFFSSMPFVFASLKTNYFVKHPPEELILDNYTVFHKRDVSLCRWDGYTNKKDDLIIFLRCIQSYNVELQLTR